MTKAGKKAVLGIIGGSGIYDLPGLTDLREEAVASPWGEPSDVLRFGRIGGTDVVFLPRHGRGHRLSPSDINYRANIDAMKRVGVTDIVSLSACGSFRDGSAAGPLRARRPVRRPHASARKLVLRSGLRGACLDGASGGARRCRRASPRRRRPRASRCTGAEPMSAWKGRNSRAMRNR